MIFRQSAKLFPICWGLARAVKNTTKVAHWSMTVLKQHMSPSNAGQHKKCDKEKMGQTYYGAVILMCQLSLRKCRYIIVQFVPMSLSSRTQQDQPLLLLLLLYFMFTFQLQSCVFAGEDSMCLYVIRKAGKVEEIIMFC